MSNNPQVVQAIKGSGSDPIEIPYSVGLGKKIVVPKFLWDSFIIHEGDTVAEHRFFTNVVGQGNVHKSQTNNEGSGRVPRGRIWKFDKVSLALNFPEKTSSVIDNMDSFFYRLRKSVIELEIDRRIYLEVPAWRITTFQSPIHTQTNIPGEIIAQDVKNLFSPLFFREETLWSVKLISDPDDPIILPEDSKTGDVMLEIMFEGKEYISLQIP
ncbi:MAG: hypothetical protein DRH24_15990 [Deltaproteobacteria bacterium]|nr:MAG: hypothetical protein DRH24_15990 [Deltaproteobacteria bacterium]